MIPQNCSKRIILPLVRLTLLISIGFFVGLIIEGMGWTHQISVMARPFMRWGHLSPQMGAVFTTAFFSGAASLSMLKSFHQEGFVDRKEMTVCVLLNTFPTFFLHLPTTLFILLPLVGKAGAVYLFLTFCAALLRLGVLLIWTHFVFSLASTGYQEKRTEKKPFKTVLVETGKKSTQRLGRILAIVLPVYLMVAIVSDAGFFLWLRKLTAVSVSGVFVPVEAMTVVIFSLVAEFTSGYAAAGAMLEAGTLNIFQTVSALLLGNIIAAPIRALRHQMPYYWVSLTQGWVCV